MAEMTKRLLTMRDNEFFNNEELRVLGHKEIFEKKAGVSLDECSRLLWVKDLALIPRVCLVHQPEDNLGQGSQTLVWRKESQFPPSYYRGDKLRKLKRTKRLTRQRGL